MNMWDNFCQGPYKVCELKHNEMILINQRNCPDLHGKNIFLVLYVWFPIFELIISLNNRLKIE